MGIKETHILEQISIIFVYTIDGTNKYTHLFRQEIIGNKMIKYLYSKIWEKRTVKLGKVEIFIRELTEI